MVVDVGAASRAVEHVLLEHARHRCRNPVGDHALALRLAPRRARVGLPVRQYDARDRHRLRVDPAGGQRGIGGRHLERRDPDRAEGDRRDRVTRELERRADPQLLRHRDDVRRTDVERKPRIHGVVGVQCRVRHRDISRIAVVVRLHVPRAVRIVRIARRIGLIVERRRQIRHGERIHAARHRRGERDHLERRPGLASRTRGEVELVALVSRGHRRHGADRARAGIDGHDRRRGIGRLGEDVRDRCGRCTL